MYWTSTAITHDSYRLNRGGEQWATATVDIDALVRVDGKLKLRRPAHYLITVFRYGPGGTSPIARVNYRPKTDPPGHRLSDRTVAQLVRGAGL